MIPMASILGQLVPTPERYKMQLTEFESVLPVKRYRVEGRGTRGTVYIIMIPMASILSHFIPIPER